MSSYNVHHLSQPLLHFGAPRYQLAGGFSSFLQTNGGAVDTYGRHMISAHTSPGSTLSDYLWAKVKGAVGLAGLSRQEAAFWHKQVYSGLVDVGTLLPTDLGAAAAYEAWQFAHRSYNMPVRHAGYRERDALLGLAIAEAIKLWTYARRPADKYGRREACEVAAATVRRLLRGRLGPYALGTSRRSRWSSAAYYLP